MKNTIKLSIALLLCSATALAATAGKPRPVACDDFSIAKTADGATYAVCVSTKGKPSVLRSFVVATVTDPSTGSAVKVAVGFR